MSSSETWLDEFDVDYFKWFEKETERRRRIIFDAVDRNDLGGLKSHLDMPLWYKIRDNNGFTLLQRTILGNKRNLFDYLLSLDDYPLHAVNKTGETALEIALAGCLSDVTEYANTELSDYFAQELLKRDVNVDTICLDGNSLLHHAFKRNFLQIARLLIEKGADYDFRNDRQQTPMHWCCSYCKGEVLAEGVAMLMYFGADPNVANNQGYVPFDIVLLKDEEDTRPSTLEALFFYTFDEHSDRHVDFEVLMRAAEMRWSLFYRLMDTVSTAHCDDDYLNYCSSHLFAIEPQYLEVFMEKFDDVIETLLAKLYYYEGDMLSYSKLMHPFSLEILDLLVNSKYRFFVIEIICEVGSTGLVEGLIAYKVPQSIITGIVCYLMSYGMRITNLGLNILYKRFKYDELFKILLHMDMDEETYEENDIIPALYYNVNVHIDTYLENPYKFSLERGIEELLSYSSRPQLKEFCCKLKKANIADKVKRLPQIPLLIELARDVFRKYFVEKLQISTSRQFYTLLKLLPIGDIQKKIISFERELYY